MNNKNFSQTMHFFEPNPFKINGIKLLITHFILDREIDEVGIYQNPIWRSQRGVVIEEKCR